jgi:large subunit ribosomal protein L14e
MFEVGRVCVKIAGRDAGKKCIIIDTLDYPYVLVDGETRRRKTNINHLHPLDRTVMISKGATHDSLAPVCEDAGITLRFTKPKKVATRPRTVRKVKPKVMKKKAPFKEATIVKEEKISKTEDVKESVPEANINKPVN